MSLTANIDKLIEAGISVDQTVSNVANHCPCGYDGAGFPKLA